MGILGKLDRLLNPPMRWSGNPPTLYSDNKGDFQAIETLCDILNRDVPETATIGESVDGNGRVLTYNLKDGMRASDLNHWLKKTLPTIPMYWTENNAGLRLYSDDSILINVLCDKLNENDAGMAEHHTKPVRGKAIHELIYTGTRYDADKLNKWVYTNQHREGAATRTASAHEEGRTGAATNDGKRTHSRRPDSNLAENSRISGTQCLVFGTSIVISGGDRDHLEAIQSIMTQEFHITPRLREVDGAYQLTGYRPPPDGAIPSNITTAVWY